MISWIRDEILWNKSWVDACASPKNSEVLYHHRQYLRGQRSWARAQLPSLIEGREWQKTPEHWNEPSCRYVLILLSSKYFQSLVTANCKTNNKLRARNNISENKSSRVLFFSHEIYINQMFMLYILQIFFKKNNYSKNDNTGLVFSICQINLFNGFLIMCMNNLSNKY